MIPPADTPVPDAKPSRARRRWLIAGIVLALLVPGFYWFENWSGRVALEKVVAEYEAAGLSLDPASFLPGPVPAEENFGATPLLDGIMHEDDDSTAGSTAAAKRKVLSDLSLLRKLSAATTPKPSKRGKAAGPVPVPTPALAVPKLSADCPEWGTVRAYLSAHTTCKPPPDEPSDVRAVYVALDLYRPIFDELTAAARRQHAILTPPPSSRLAMWHQDDFPLSNELVALGRLLLLRIKSAAATGHHDEVPPLLQVLWQLGSACKAEPLLLGHLLARHLRHQWSEGVRASMGEPGVTDQHLAQSAATCPADWVPELELMMTWRAVAALRRSSLAALRANSHSPADRDSSSFREKMLRYGPSGWWEQNCVTDLTRSLHFIQLPLKHAGFAALPGACHALEELDASDQDRWSLYRISGYGGGQVLLRSSVWRIHEIRLTLLAIGMERYRLRHGRYPADAAALVPDCIAAIPPDMDGAPLRIVTSPDGATCVLYSIGWNLTDDWHGIIPASYTAAEEMKNADWPLALPFPPLPPP